MNSNFQYFPCEFLDILSEPVSLISDSFTFEFVNHSFCNLFNKEKKELEGLNITSLFKPADLARLLPEIRRAFNGEKFSITFHLQNANAVIPYQLFMFPRYSQNETVNSIVLSFKQDGEPKISNEFSNFKSDWKLLEFENLPDLQEIKKMFNIIAEYSNDFIYITDMDQNFTYLSPSVEKFLGYSLLEAYNLHVKDIMTEESYNYQLNLFKSYLEKYADDLSNVRAIDQIEQVRKDGTRFWSETNASLILDENNNPAGIFGIARDITYQKKKERALEERNEQYQLLANYATDMLYIIDLTDEQNFYYISPSIQNILGYTAEEAYSLSAKELLTKESYEYQNRVLQENLKNATDYSNLTQTLELQVVHKDGTIIWGEFHTRLVTNEKGEPIEIIGIMRDITERKKAEERDKKYQNDLLWLSQSATKFLTLETEDAIYDYIGKTLSYWIDNAVFVVNKINESNDTVTVKNVYGISHSFFTKVIEILGFNPVGNTYQFVDELKQLYRQNRIMRFEGGLRDFSFGYFPGFLLKQVERLLKIKGIYSIGLKRQNHWYAIIHIFKTKSPELNEKNLLETFLNQASIVLQRKQMEQQWLKAKEEAEQSDRLKTAFLSNMSHEIRTPLNIIIGYNQMLEEDSISSDEKMRYIESIKESSEQLLHVIDDIILISKVETGQFELVKETFNINDLLNNVLFEYRELASKKGNLLEFDNKNRNCEILIYSDFDKIKQIIAKLLDNAIKFTDSGRISLGLEKKANYLQFNVSDTGLGIPFEQKEKVFDNFYQVDHLNNRKFEGTGLGLSICKSLVKSLGGDIWVDSGESRGTTIYFTVPVEEPG
jgi:PAS domain S-box-containing protein